MTYAEELRRLLREAHARSGRGVLAFEQSLGFPGGALKAILDTSEAQTPRLDKAERIAKALGLEFYIGPPRGSAEQASIPHQHPDAGILEIRPPKGSHWYVPDRNPGDLFFFRPMAHFQINNQDDLIEPSRWGLADASVTPQPGRRIVVQRASDRGMNIGRLRGQDPDGSMAIFMHGKSGVTYFTSEELLGLWVITWTGITPPNFAIDGKDDHVNDGDIIAARQKVVAGVDDLLRQVFPDKNVQRVRGEDT